MALLTPTNVDVGYDLIQFMQEFHELLEKHDVTMVIEAYHAGRRLQFRKTKVPNVGMTVLYFPHGKGVFQYVPSKI